jgi:hypothetical protein
MRRIVFLKGPDQLRSLQSQEEQLLRSAEVIALSARAWLDLRRAGLAPRAASEFLSAEEMREIVYLARRLSQLWFKPFEHHLSYKGINLGELVRIENNVFFREMIAGDLIARRLAEHFRPEEVYIFSRQQTPCLRGHRTSSAHDVCEAALTYSFAHAGVKVINLHRTDRGRFPFIPLSYKQNALRIARFLKNPRTVLQERQCKEVQTTCEPLRVPIEDERLLLGMGEEVDLLSLAPLIEIIDAAPGYRAVLVNSDSEILSVGTRSGLGTVPAERVFQLVSAYTTTADNNIAPRIERARQEFDAARRERVYGKDSPLNNRLLDFHFNAIWISLTRAVIPHIDRASALLESVRPDGVIVAGVEQAKDRATVKIARNLDIRTIAIPHGYIGSVDAYEFETDLFLAWGESSRQCLIEEFVKKPESIEVFGPPHLNRLPRNTRYQPPSGSRRVLALTSRVSPVCYDAVDPVAFEAVWREILSFIERSPEVELIIKPHPGGKDFTEYYERLCEQLPDGRARIETSRRLEEMAGEVDAVIAVIDPSTAILVAQLLLLPTLYIRASWREMLWAARAWGLPDGIESVDSVDEIAPALDRLMNDEVFRQHCIERGRHLVENNLKPWGLSGPDEELIPILNDFFASQTARIDPTMVCA